MATKTKNVEISIPEIDIEEVILKVRGINEMSKISENNI